MFKVVRYMQCAFLISLCCSNVTVVAMEVTVDSVVPAGTELANQSMEKMKSFFSWITAFLTVENAKMVAKPFKIIIVETSSFVLHNPGTAATWAVVIGGSYKLIRWYQGSIIKKINDLANDVKKTSTNVESTQADVKNIIQNINILQGQGSRTEGNVNTLLSRTSEQGDLLIKSNNLLGIVQNTQKDHSVQLKNVQQTQDQLLSAQNEFGNRMNQLQRQAGEIKEGQQTGFRNLSQQLTEQRSGHTDAIDKINSNLGDLKSKQEEVLALLRRNGTSLFSVKENNVDPLQLLQKKIMELQVMVNCLYPIAYVGAAMIYTVAKNPSHTSVSTAMRSNQFSALYIYNKGPRALNDRQLENGRNNQ